MKCEICKKEPEQCMCPKTPELCDNCPHDTGDCGIPPPQYNCNLIKAIKEQSRLSAIDEAIEVVKGWHATREDIVEALEALKKG